MRFVIQRVSEADVKVDDAIIGQIGKGFLVLIGVGQNDTKEIADKMLKKMIGLRIFEDENGKTNLALADVDGQLLWYRSLHYMRTVKRGIVQALRIQVHRIWQRNFMNTSLQDAKKVSLW